MTNSHESKIEQIEQVEDDKYCNTELEDKKTKSQEQDKTDLDEAIGEKDNVE